MKYELQLYSPHAAQLAFHQSNARYRVAAWGRQSGKSTACGNELLKRAWENPNTKYWFVSPTHEQAKLQYRRTIGMLSPCWSILKKKNQTELRVKLINDSEITFKSGEVSHNLRGATLHGVVIDEVRQQPSDLWVQVLRPMLTTTKGWAAFVSTPNGFDFFYDLYQNCLEDPLKKWEYFHAPSTCNPLFTQEEYDQSKRDMSESEFAQEILAEFRDLTRGSAYLSFSQLNQSSVSPLVSLPTHTPLVSGASPESVSTLANPFLPIHLSCDFNVNHMGWVMSQFRHGIGHYAFDEIWITQKTNTNECISVFIDKFRSYEKELGSWRADPQVLLMGDSTGNANKTSAAGETDWRIIENALKKAGISYRNMNSSLNPTVKDRVNTVNTRLKSADGTVQAWLHPKRCRHLLKDLQRVTWKANGQGAILDQTTDPERTHLSDAWGYDICITNPISSVKDVGSLRVIRR